MSPELRTVALDHSSGFVGPVRLDRRARRPHVCADSIVVVPERRATGAACSTAGQVRKGRVRRKDKRAVPVAEALKAVEVARDNAEHERRLRAVALATATACAEISEILLPASVLSSDWRLVNRARQLGRLPTQEGGAVETLSGDG